MDESNWLFAPHRRKRQTVGGTTCCVPGCYNNTKEDAQRMSFYQIPLQGSVRKVWLNRIGRAPAFRPRNRSQAVVCGNHFVGRRKSKLHPVPSVFPLRSEARYGFSEPPAGSRQSSQSTRPEVELEAWKEKVDGADECDAYGDLDRAGVMSEEEHANSDEGESVEMSVESVSDHGGISDGVAKFQLKWRITSLSGHEGGKEVLLCHAR